ncbi:MAG: hypothetical protein J6Z34_02880 [Clostridia bacterium]|nr:hypothetical protein [Clostridia bacterium]
MDKLRYFLYMSILLLVLSVVCVIITEKFTLEFYISVASVAICAIVTTGSIIAMKRRK